MGRVHAVSVPYVKEFSLNGGNFFVVHGALECSIFRDCWGLSSVLSVLVIVCVSWTA